MTEENRTYITHLKVTDVPWHRLTTAYGRGTDFPAHLTVLEQMRDLASVKESLYELTTNMEHQSTLWHATPFGMVFLSRILEKALADSGQNPAAHFLAGEHAVGQPFRLTCKCCGQEFASKRTNTLFCGPNCRAKFYRQEAAESRSRECTCENCSIVFTTTRSDVKYCSDDCRYQAQIKRQGARKKALREAKNEKETKTA